MNHQNLIRFCFVVVVSSLFWICLLFDCCFNFVFVFRSTFCRSQITSVLLVFFSKKLPREGNELDSHSIKWEVSQFSEGLVHWSNELIGNQRQIHNGLYKCSEIHTSLSSSFAEKLVSSLLFPNLQKRVNHENEKKYWVEGQACQRRITGCFCCKAKVNDFTFE